ncbi:MAG TPA: protein translocase subunit SecF [Mycobacteriales bacterium]|nr:protein translocase subunit SecF [Mycobacteriales bacterium]
MSLVRRLYRSETNFNFVGSRRRWYVASALVVVICILSFAVRGFNFGIEFKGGTSFQFPDTVRGAAVSLTDARTAVTGAKVEVVSTQTVGSGGTRSVLVKTPELSVAQEQAVKRQLSTIGVSPNDVSISSVSSSWGGDITRKAVQALVVFLIAVCLFIAVRFEWRMAVAAIIALLHDLIVSAGAYSLIGFEVTPSTVVGLLTILGFSLYDTVVVFDKVAENTRGILGGARTTFSAQANLAVNQTLMRSINTSLIALLPVAGLLFVGAGLLGVGTIKDLALVLFVGLAVGAYSSLFLATPILCDLKEREPQYAALRKRVMAKAASASAKAAAVAELNDRAGSDDEDAALAPGNAEPAGVVAASTTPRPGARPQNRRPRPQQRKGGGRPAAKRRR